MVADLREGSSAQTKSITLPLGQFINRPEAQGIAQREGICLVRANRNEPGMDP